MPRHAETLTRHGYPITAEQVLERFLGVSIARHAKRSNARSTGSCLMTSNSK
jgi:hypothetical protein